MPVVGLKIMRFGGFPVGLHRQILSGLQGRGEAPAPQPACHLGDFDQFYTASFLMGPHGTTDNNNSKQAGRCLARVTGQDPELPPNRAPGDRWEMRGTLIPHSRGGLVPQSRAGPTAILRGTQAHSLEGERLALEAAGGLGKLFHLSFRAWQDETLTRGVWRFPYGTRAPSSGSSGWILLKVITSCL